MSAFNYHDLANLCKNMSDLRLAVDNGPPVVSFLNQSVSGKSKFGRYIMETIINVDFPFQLNRSLLLSKIKIEEDPMNEDYLTFSKMLSEAEHIARPKYGYGIASIDEKTEQGVVVEGRLFASKLVRKNLDHAHWIIPYLATCGTEIDAWSRRYTDLLENYWADEIKNQVLQQAIGHLYKTIKKTYFSDQDVSQMSPGSLPDWPITEQRPLFDLMGDVAAIIGMTLTDSCLMIPSKSVSGFYFSAQEHFENCRLCPRVHCPGRRVPYDPHILADDNLFPMSTSKTCINDEPSEKLIYQNSQPRSCDAPLENIDK